jgi:transaldolase
MLKSGGQTVLLAKEVIPYITGRVHAQTSPKYAYDTAKTVEHAERLVATFEAHGISRCVSSSSLTRNACADPI